MSKMDRQGVRTPADLEQKYQFGKKFSEIMGLVDDTRNAISTVESNLQHEILSQVTSITRDTKKIIMDALESYVDRDDLGELKTTLDSEFSQMASKIAMDFYKQTEGQISDVNGNLEDINETLEKHFDFDVNGLTIKAGESELRLRIDNDVIAFYKGEIDENDLAKNRFGWWDGVNFYTGNIFIEVEERAQLGDFAFVPRSNGSLDFLKVGG